MGVCTLLISIFFVILFPPIGVMIHDGVFCDRRVLISLVLTLIGYIPGLIYSAVIISEPRPQNVLYVEI